ncbi:nucleotide exchange factor GrpE [Roseimarinus sediminis]|uniref:nucleotide exchange factor GrpE n=1 Tax=Roseimarinus sediminis TaxID=1610899 RepID=UPI003D1956D8
MTEKTKNNQTADEKTVQQDAAPENIDVKKEKKEEKADSKKEAKKSDKKSKKDSGEEKIEILEQKLAQKDDQYLRLQAEFDNYRKRTLKEKMEMTKSAGESILINVLPVMDDFERALRSMEEATEASAVKDGLDLIYKRFSDFLKQNGIKEIEASETDFDTDLHEAITKIPAPTEELKGKVVDVIQKGYLLNDKVIRYAKVVIGE